MMSKKTKNWPDLRRFAPLKGEALKKAQELAERAMRGTIMEAIGILKKETGEFINIETAVRNGEIPSYAPGSCKPLGTPAKNMSVVLDDEEVYADDLNAWLDKNYPRVEYRFPKPVDAPAAVERGAPDAGMGTANKTNDEPPGITDGMVTITKLAITAAWEIESELGRKAAAKNVIKRLQEWVTSNKYAELIEIIPRGVKWMTSAPDEKKYDIDACRATLKAWHSKREKSRA
jgi:hypothetical protein